MGSNPGRAIGGVRKGILLKLLLRYMQKPCWQQPLVFTTRDSHRD